MQPSCGTRGFFLSASLLAAFFFLGNSAASAQDVVLTWDPNKELTLLGYKVYYGTSSRSYKYAVNVGKNTTYTVKGLSPGTYYFTVTAFNLLGIESKFSNEVSKTVAGTSSTTSTLTTSCSYSVSPTSKSFTSAGGSGSVSVTAASGCSWIASSNASWISITSGFSGSGNGTVSYSVQPNLSTNSRTGAMTIAGKSFSVTQSGLQCTLSLSPLGQNVGGDGGSFSVSVTVPAGCGWAVGSDVSWITLNSAGSGSGSGTVRYTVASNPTNKDRTGTLTIGGLPFGVNQEGRNTLLFSQVAGEEDWSSEILLVNPSATETATGTVALRNDYGEPVAASFNNGSPADTISFSIPPLGSATFTMQEPVAGSARVDADVPVSGVMKYFHPDLGIVGLGDSIPLHKSTAAVVRHQDRGLNTLLAVTNAGDSDVVMSLSLRGADGIEVFGGSASEILPARGRLAKRIDELFPDADTSDFQGSVMVVSGGVEGSLAATALQVGAAPADFTTLPVVPDPANESGELHFAHFAAGGGWTTSLFLVNPSDAPGDAELSFYDSGGNRVALSVNGGPASDSAYSRIESLGTTVLHSGGEVENMVSGPARVAFEGPIGAMLKLDSITLGTAAISGGEPVAGFIVPVSRSATGNWTSGVAVASVGSMVTVTLTLRNKDGQPVAGGLGTLELPANGSAARLLEQWFPDADTTEFEGTVTVSVESGSIVGAGLHIGSRAGQITALPLAELR